MQDTIEVHFWSPGLRLLCPRVTVRSQKNIKSKPQFLHWWSAGDNNPYLLGLLTCKIRISIECPADDWCPINAIYLLYFPQIFSPAAYASLTSIDLYSHTMILYYSIQLPGPSLKSHPSALFSCCATGSLSMPWIHEGGTQNSARWPWGPPVHWWMTTRQKVSDPCLYFPDNSHISSKFCTQKLTSTPFLPYTRIRTERRKWKD